MIKTLRLLTLLLALGAFAAQPALARQEPPPSEEPQSTTPDPDEAAAEAAPPEQTPPPTLSGQAGQPGASIPDGAGFESRIRASADAAEGLQGPLDGGWTIRSENGEALFGLQLVDKNGGELEGAWRDMRRVGAVGARGLVASMVRVGDDLTLRFYPIQGGDAVLLEVHAFGDNIWTGSLTENGAQVPVSLVRNTARPTGDYSGVPRGPVLPPGYYVARPHHAAPAASRHDDDGGRSCKTVGKGRKKHTVCSSRGGSDRSGKHKGGKGGGSDKGGRHKGGSDKGGKHGSGKNKGGSSKGGSGKKKKR